MKHIIAIKNPADFAEQINKISIAKGKDTGFFISLKKVKEKYVLSVICNNGLIQGTVSMVVGWLGKDLLSNIKKKCKPAVNEESVDKGEQEEDREDFCEWDDENSIAIYVEPLFLEAVKLLAKNPNTMMVEYNGKLLNLQNPVSKIDIALTKNFLLLENPKAGKAKKLELKIRRDILTDGLPFIKPALSVSSLNKYGNHYGLLPTSDGNSILHIMASNGYNVAFDSFMLADVPKTYIEDIKKLRYAMIPADKFDQIVASKPQGETGADGDVLTLTFFYNDDGITPRQVNIKNGADQYQIMTTLNLIYPKEFVERADSNYQEHDCDFLVEVGDLQTALDISSLSEAKKTIFEVSKSQIVLRSETGRQRSELKGVINMDSQMELIVFGLSNVMLNAILRPYNGRIQINCSDFSQERKRVVSFESSGTTARICLAMMTPEDVSAVPSEEDEEKKSKKRKK